MPMLFRLAVRPNISRATVLRTHRDAECIVDGLPFMTDHQASHLRPVLPGLLPAMRQLSREMAVSTGEVV